MANGNPKVFLNEGILGSGAIPPTGKGFHAIPTENIGNPEYDSRFFETFPTVWASAYTFTCSLDAGDRQAVEEWASLFLLHYYGTVHLSFYERDVLQDERAYDKDLWLALSGTYPLSGNGSLQGVGLLTTAEQTVVGAFYPDVIFFPGRGSSTWADDTILKNLLTREQRLSWARCSASLLKTDADRRDFHLHLLRIAALLPAKKYRDLLRGFCADTFAERIDYDAEQHGRLDPNPRRWMEIPGNNRHEPEELLKVYPLRKMNGDGGYNYYLLAGIQPLLPWMTAASESRWPAPNQYYKIDERHIGVKFAGKLISCELQANVDKIFLLKELLLSDAPYWCKLPDATDTSKIRPEHRLALQDPVIAQNEIAICLAPVTGKFLGHFPEVLQNFKSVRAAAVQGGSVDWTFEVRGEGAKKYEVKWRTKPVGSLEMPNTSLAVWPPKLSERWKLYAAFGTGSKETCGRWHLIDEEGRQAVNFELGRPENSFQYVSILQHPGTAPNRPRALLFTDSQDSDRGALLLSDLGDHPVGEEAATLSVDFGTSNTCVAYGVNSTSEVLNFELSPEMFWGRGSGVELPGFVPFKWNRAKEFFPTVLLSRISDGSLPNLDPAQIKLEHLFKVDIPGLHKDIERHLFKDDSGLKDIWRIHPDLKWDPNPKTPWRSLFLELILLYAHAELFFNKNTIVDKYVFTYPLAFTGGEAESFHKKARAAIQKIRQYCYRPDLPLANWEYIDKINESAAIASYNRDKANPAVMEGFIDVGGGTADIAIRHNNEFLVLDSVRVAGRTFFRFAERNFKEKLAGSPRFKQHLKMLLEGTQGVEMVWPQAGFQTDLGTYYSVFVNQISNEQFREREEAILKEGMGRSSYQRYRTRLFFRHLITYTLLQACAAAVERQLKPTSGIKLILGGNAWGLLMFAELRRDKSKLKDEAAMILKLLQKFLRDSVTEEERPYLEGLKIFEVKLLNEDDLSTAKVVVALGALLADPERLSVRTDDAPYAGITLSDLRINEFEPATVRWCDHWSMDDFREKFGDMDQINSADFKAPNDLTRPLDPALTVFTCLGNAGNINQDILPAETWNSINGEVIENIAYLKGERVEQSPINHFASEVLYPSKATSDHLDVLAGKTGNHKADREN